MKIVKYLLTMILAVSLYVAGVITQKQYGLGNLLKKAAPLTYRKISAPDTIPQRKHAGKLQIFILAGQSNMEGDGDVSEYTSQDTKGKVYVFNENYQWVIGREPVKNGKIGPSIAFAKGLIDNDSSINAGIINCARGGTNIAQWQKNLNELSLYANMLKRARASSVQGEIKGLLFFQGENDAEGDSTDHYNNWSIYFEKFISDIRKDLGESDLPVIFAQIGQNTNNNSLWEEVKQEQEKVDLHNVLMIKTDDIPYQAGKIHYTTSGYLEIGKRFSDAYFTMHQKIEESNKAKVPE